MRSLGNEWGLCAYRLKEGVSTLGLYKGYDIHVTLLQNVIGDQIMIIAFVTHVRFKPGL